MHKRINFKRDNKIFITLYKNYNLFKNLRKITKLQYNLFKIIKQMGILIYCLKLFLI